MAVALGKDGFSTNVVTKNIRYHHATITGVIKLKPETCDVENEV